MRLQKKRSIEETSTSRRSAAPTIRCVPAQQRRRGGRVSGSCVEHVEIRRAVAMP